MASERVTYSMSSSCLVFTDSEIDLRDNCNCCMSNCRQEWMVAGNRSAGTRRWLRFALSPLLPAVMSADLESQWHTITVRIPFTSERHATIAKQVIEVDKELQPQAVKRELTVEGKQLVATFKTLTVRLSRLTLNAFLENVDLVVRTLGEFGEDAESNPT